MVTALRPRLRTALTTLHRVVGRERVRAHLARAEARLRVATPGDDVDSTARRRCLDVLRQYWLAGQFPANEVADDRTPLFRDSGGTRCAMGELAFAADRTDVVETVATGDNTVDLETDDPPEPLETWLEEAPLTPCEAARVQPTYGPQCPPPGTCSQYGLLVWSVGLVAFLWLERTLYLSVGRLFPDDTVRRVGTLAVGTLGLAGMLSTLGFWVWFTLFH